MGTNASISWEKKRRSKINIIISYCQELIAIKIKAKILLLCIKVK
jgi:hypothetical protein